MDKTGRTGRPRTAEGGSPNPVDVHVGNRVLLRRGVLGMSRSKLARSVKLTFQQMQKFELGTNRISASRLFDLAQVLEVPVGFFFDDMPQNLAGAAKPSGASGTPRFAANLMSLNETAELLRAYHRIRDQAVRRRFFEMTRALAADSRFGAGEADAPPPASDPEQGNGVKRAS